MLMYICLLLNFQYALSDVAQKNDTNLPTIIYATEKDSQKNYTLLQGQQLIVSLKSNKTTGFSWKFSSKNQHVLKEVKPSTYNVPKKSMIGSGGTEQFYFEGMKMGTTELLFTYQRPWEKASAPSRTFKIFVTVR
jgi:inhibitor of cysteine peptidase